MDMLIQTIDSIFFFYFCLSVTYLFVFAIAALFRRTDAYPMAQKRLRYAVFLPEGSLFTAQKYPEELYDIISYNNLYSTIKVLDDTKYDMVVILGETNHVSANLLDEINRAHEAGATAIQLHHIIAPITNSRLRIKAINEEVRNSFFKQGQIRFGLSSALDGIDMALESAWLKKNLKSPKSNLEKRLVRQNIFVEYLEHSHIESKTPRTSQYHVRIAQAISALPEAVMTTNWNYLNKIIQWLLPSWTTLLISIAFIASLMVGYHWTSSLKWWGILFALIFTICLAIPDYTVEKSSKKK